jgi:serine/threonine protein kinase
VYTYIQSRFYRAPEGEFLSHFGGKYFHLNLHCVTASLNFIPVILGGKYGMPIDMWSLGCILAELYTGFAILPGEDESDQLACIIELLGMPPKQVLENSKRAKIFFNAKGYPRYCSLKTLDDGSVLMTEGFSRRGIQRNIPGSRKLKHALNGCDDVYFLQFISECLEWVPEKRLTPEQAFKHSWFKRRLPKLPHASGNGGSSSNSYSGNLNPTKPQPQSLTTSNNALVMDSKEPSPASSSTIASNKGITANCFYYDNTLHQLNANNNQQASAVSGEDAHKSLPGNSATLSYHQNIGGGASATSKLSDKYQCESYQDLSNRKSMTLNRLMSTSLHSASTLSLVSSHNSSSSNTVNNNGSSAATGISHLTSSSKLPSLN